MSRESAPSERARRPKEPTFSIVIPAYNAARTVEATLRSVLAQTEGDFEAIVVDDGSTDATTQRVRAISSERVRLVRQPNGGLAAARNAGVGAARGVFVSFLDSDDLWLPTYLAEMRGALEDRPEVAIAYTDAWVWHESIQRFGRETIVAPVAPPAAPPDDPAELFRSLVARNYFYVSTTVRREVLAQVGGFDQSVSPSEDWDMWLRIAERGYRASRAAPVLAIYRMRAGSLSSNRAVMLEAERRVLRKTLSYDLDNTSRELVETRLSTLESSASRKVLQNKSGRPFPRLVPPVARVDHYRLTPPPGVPPALVRLLRASGESS